MHWVYRRFWRQKRAHRRLSSEPPVLPPIKLGDTQFLESLIRHTEDTALFQSRASTQPLLCPDGLSPPPKEPPEDVSLPSYRPASVHLPIGPSDILALPIVRNRPSTSPGQPREYNDLLSHHGNQFLLLRTPHPPTSYALSPPNIIHSRQSSQSRSSLGASSCDHTVHGISSISLNSTTNCSSLPFHRLSCTSASNNKRASPPSVIPFPSGTSTYPTARTGSITVSIGTDEGMREDFDFPSPPNRRSGCWFAQRANNQTPRPFLQEHEEIIGPCKEDIDASELALAQQSQISLGTSIPSSRPQALPLSIPRARTFGYESSSILCLNGQASDHAKGGQRLSTMPSEDDLGNMIVDEEIQSVCSAFADMSMGSMTTYDDADDPLSDTGSFADPSIM